MPIGEGLEMAVAEKQETGALSAEQAQTFFSPAKKTPLMKEREALVRFRKKISPNLYRKVKRLNSNGGWRYIQLNQPQLARLIHRHVEQYRWVGLMHFWGEPYSEVKCLEQILQAGRSAFKHKAPILPSDLLGLHRQARAITYWRQMCADTCAHSSYAVMKRFSEIGSHIDGTRYDEIMWFTPAEFIRFMRTGQKPVSQTLKARRKGYGLYQTGQTRRVFTGRQLSRLLAKFVKKPKSKNFVYGRVANPGRAQGTVRIVLRPDEISKVRQGDIMVSSETTPDFIAAMNRAGAIITDRGGISSHAAIVSRELGIPCIVGTEIATRIFKDGDQVEVDASRGNVRKI